MDKATEIVLRAIITNLARQDGGAQFLHGFAQSLFAAAEEQLVGDPVTIHEIGRFADLAVSLRGPLSN
jgi:hypothetical protein